MLVLQNMWRSMHMRGEMRMILGFGREMSLKCYGQRRVAGGMENLRTNKAGFQDHMSR